MEKSPHLPWHRPNKWGTSFCFVLSCLSHSTKQGSQSLWKCLISITYLLLINSDYPNPEKNLHFKYSNFHTLQFVPNPVCSSRSYVAFRLWALCTASSGVLVLWLSVGVWQRDPGSSLGGPDGDGEVGICMPFIPFLPGSFWLAMSFHQTGLLHARPSVFWTLLPLLSLEPRSDNSSIIIKPGYCATLCKQALCK